MHLLAFKSLKILIYDLPNFDDNYAEEGVVEDNSLEEGDGQEEEVPRSRGVEDNDESYLQERSLQVGLEDFHRHRENGTDSEPFDGVRNLELVARAGEVRQGSRSDEEDLREDMDGNREGDHQPGVGRPMTAASEQVPSAEEVGVEGDVEIVAAEAVEAYAASILTLAAEKMTSTKAWNYSVVAAETRRR